MEKRELFIFAGQSNMMGACVYSASEQIYFARSYEYLHKPKRMGAKTGGFKSVGFPSGEFSYQNIDFAYQPALVASGKSSLDNYRENTYFCPSMSNLKSEQDKTVYDFSFFSEQTATIATTLAPFIVSEWEKLGRQCIYAHISKGSVAINYFFDEKMIEEVNGLICEYNKNANYPLANQVVGNNASKYFFDKISDCIIDSQEKFPENSLGEKCFFWLQGESDARLPKDLYKIYLTVLWNNLKSKGFTKFFCIRVGYFMNDGIIQIMKAQEEFCDENEDAFILTRVCSYMPTTCQDLAKWYAGEDMEEYLYCRDSYYGFNNQHINEKGFKIIANSAIKNMERILIKNKQPVLEREKCVMMLDFDSQK